jgi:uncharacterized protein (TIGR03435 family)
MAYGQDGYGNAWLRRNRPNLFRLVVSEGSIPKTSIGILLGQQCLHKGRYQAPRSLSCSYFSYIPPKVMAADAKPSFEDSTIKPSRPEARFSLLLNQSGMLNTTATSVSDLIKFAYGVHPKQIVGGPAWMESDKFDVTGKPDTPGIPNVPQLQMMIQKLLADRFQLAFHKDKRELNVYAIIVTKTGSKITKADPSPLAVPGFAGGGQRGMNVRNSTIAEFAGILQANVLDRPVIDQTGFGLDRFNFILKWTPDGAQLQGAGAPPNALPTVPDAEAPPDIFTAFQQQLGLKLDSVKAPVDALVIDKVEKPSDN